MHLVHPSVLSRSRRVVALLSLVMTLTSSHVQVVHAAEGSLSATPSATGLEAADDDDNTIVDFVIPWFRTTKSELALRWGELDSKGGVILPQISKGLLESLSANQPIPDKMATLKTIHMDVTAYTSSVAECDSDPFVTADGTIVRDGIVATNVLPFGTKIRIPKYFGDRVFEVHDRMNPRYKYRVDVWMSDTRDMRNLGIKRAADIEVVEWGDGKSQWAGWTKKRLAEASRQAAIQLKNAK